MSGGINCRKELFKISPRLALLTSSTCSSTRAWNSLSPSSLTLGDTSTCFNLFINYPKVWVYIHAARQDVLLHRSLDGCASGRCCSKTATWKWTEGTPLVKVTYFPSTFSPFSMPWWVYCWLCPVSPLLVQPTHFQHCKYNILISSCEPSWWSFLISPDTLVYHSMRSRLLLWCQC